jgi:hypothetical protein
MSVFLLMISPRTQTRTSPPRKRIPVERSRQRIVPPVVFELLIVDEKRIQELGVRSWNRCKRRMRIQESRAN